MNVKTHKKQCCVVIPFHDSKLNESQKVSVRSIKSKLPGYDIYFSGPKEIKEAFREFESFRTRYKFFDKSHFNSIKSYNQLLISHDFYLNFSDYEYMLIAQTDCLIFSDDLEYWCNKGYSYIGSPWFKGFSNPVKPLEFYGVGNGGLSLRRVSDFLQVTSFRIQTNSLKGVLGSLAIFATSVLYKVRLVNIGEDRFWGMVASKYTDFFTVPNAVDAAHFSFEVKPEYLYERIGHLPFGCHAWERYNKTFWLNHLDEYKKIQGED